MKAMEKKIKIWGIMIALAAILSLTLESCREDRDAPPVNVITAPSFKATNISVTEEEPMVASDNSIIVNVNYSVTITVDGVTEVYTGTRNSNELPVWAGNEVEIRAYFDGDAPTSNICFTMPDRTVEYVSKENPVCKWTVPTDFGTGDKIVAQWVTQSGKILYQNLSSSITLISL